MQFSNFQKIIFSIMLFIHGFIWFDVLCLNFSIETKVKASFVISYFNLSEKNEIAFRYTDSIHSPISLKPFAFSNQS